MSREQAFAKVDLMTAELEMTASIYDGFSTAIVVKGQPRTVGLFREFDDAVQVMALIEQARPMPVGGEGEPTEAMIQAGLKVDFANEDERATIINVWQAMRAVEGTTTRPEVARPVAWRTLDDAPKDGTVIDVWRSEGGRDTVFWGYPHHECGEMCSLCDSDWHSIRAPGWVCNTFDEFLGRAGNPFTHWKPLDGGPDATTAAPEAEKLRVELELLEEVCARYADDEDAFLSDDGEPYGSITTECGLKAREARLRFKARTASLRQKGRR